MSEKSEKIREKSKKNLMKMRSMLCNTLWSETRSLITKKHFSPFRVLLNVGIDPNFPQKSFFFFLGFTHRKIALSGENIITLRLAQSFTI